MNPPRKKPEFDPIAPPANPSVVQVASLKAMAEGIATEHQQKVAMAFIVKEICGVDEVTFVPGPDGDRLSAFAEGKRRVGSIIRSYVAADISRFKDPSTN